MCAASTDLVAMFRTLTAMNRCTASAKARTVVKASTTGSSSASMPTSTGKRNVDDTRGRGGLRMTKKPASASKSKSRTRLSLLLARRSRSLGFWPRRLRMAR